MPGPPQAISGLLLGLALPERPFVPVRRLVSVMEELGYDETPVRVAMSRQLAAGSFERQRRGRESLYRLSERYAEHITALQRREEGFGHAEGWDGQWTILSFSLPEERRNVRYLFVSRLRFIGFGRARENMWCAARRVDEELKELIEDFELESYVDVFLGSPSPLEDVHDLMRRCWDLDEIGERYARFSKEFGWLNSARARRKLRYFELVHTWLDATIAFGDLVLHDPDLPPSLLPADAQRSRSAALATVETIEQTLRPVAVERLLTMLSPSP